MTESLRNEPRGPRITAGDTTFTVAHYTGKVTYDVRAMAAKNRDFLPPEMIETLRMSSDNHVKLMFTNQLSKSGNLTAPSPPAGMSRPQAGNAKKSRWGAALVAETGKCRVSHSCESLTQPLISALSISEVQAQNIGLYP